MSELISLDDFREVARDKPSFSPTVRLLATGESIAVVGKDRTRRFCFSDGSSDRATDKINPNGWKTGPFMSNPVALWAHDSSAPPIGRASNVSVENSRLMGDIEFAPAETYAFADTVYRLVEGGFVKAVSVGFKPLKWQFSTDKDRPYGIDFEEQELLEISLCPVPCNANALIEARAKGINTRPLMEWAERVLDGDGGKLLISRQTLEDIFKATNTPHSARARYRSLTETKMAEWKCGASRDLPVSDSDGWDGPAAEHSIFEWAGGDDFDPAKARKGFLFYDASNSKERGSYKDPIAHVDGGKLVVPKGAIRAAASRLPQTDVPDSVKKEGEAVLAHYKEKAGIKAMGEGSNPNGGELVGHCGREKDEECGMKDPAECAIHAPEVKAAKAGRRMAAKHRVKMDEAVFHHKSAVTHHEAAMECIRDVMSDDDGEDGKEKSDGDLHITAKNKAKLKEAAYHQESADAHHKAAVKCLKDILSGDSDTNDEEPDADDDKPDLHVRDDDLSPEERRVKQARALKRSLAAA